MDLPGGEVSVGGKGMDCSASRKQAYRPPDSTESIDWNGLRTHMLKYLCIDLSVSPALSAGKSARLPLERFHFHFRRAARFDEGLEHDLRRDGVAPGFAFLVSQSRVPERRLREGR